MLFSNINSWEIRKVVCGIAVVALIAGSFLGAMPAVSSAQTTPAEACSALGGTWIADDCLGISEFTICLLANNPTINLDELEASLNVLGTSLDDLDCTNEDDEGGDDNGSGDDGDNGDGDGDDNGDSNGGDDGDDNGSSGSSNSSGGGGGGKPHKAGTPSSVSWKGDDEGEVAGASTDECSEPLLTTFLRMGRDNDTDEVIDLQNFLNGELGIELETNGTFDSATDAAVKEFQLKYADEVLTPWLPYGLESVTTPTGYVYKTTQRMINKIYCEALDIPMPQLP